MNDAEATTQAMLLPTSNRMVSYSTVSIYMNLTLNSNLICPWTCSKKAVHKESPDTKMCGPY